MMSGLDWTEELKKRTGIDFLTTRPMEIEKKSFEIIKGELGEEFVSRYPADALPVLCRVIHTTADFSYRDTLTITEGAIGLAKEAIHRGLPDHHRYDDGGIRDQQDGGQKIRDRCALLYRG